MDHREEKVLVRTSFDDEKNAGILLARGPRSESSTPPLGATSDISTPPKTIILGLWPHARNHQIEYYLRGYRSLYPTARLLLLHHSRTSTKHIDGVLSSLVGDHEKQSLHHIQAAGVLIHLFGDDAASQICRLLRSYRLRTARPLDVKSIILDSVPIVAASNFRSIRHSPTLLLAFILPCVAYTFWTLASVLTLRFFEPDSTQVRRDLHDSSYLPATARKCYIFPDNDLMFTWDRPTNDDELCQRQDFRVRRDSIDQKLHWTSNQERYWLGIEDAWDAK